MKPFIHAKLSAKAYGGIPEDYLELHNEMDQTKSALPDVRHRAILHSAYGVFLIEKIFGTTMTNSEGKVYSTRDVAEDHIIQDLGFIPTMEEWLKNLPIEDWMMGKAKTPTRRRQILFNPPDEETTDPLNPNGGKVPLIFD